jgi:hypothetical protein
MKKVQFGYKKQVVGVRWPSGKRTMINGSVPLSMKEVRILLSLESIKKLKSANARGEHLEIAGVFVTHLNWNGWNAGLGE